MDLTASGVPSKALTRLRKSKNLGGLYLANTRTDDEVLESLPTKD